MVQVRKESDGAYIFDYYPGIQHRTVYKKMFGFCVTANLHSVRSNCCE